ncbi:MAG: hypothetical protein AAF688_12560 [Bacteroidota bacterium]
MKRILSVSMLFLSLALTGQTTFSCMEPEDCARMLTHIDGNDYNGQFFAARAINFKTSSVSKSVVGTFETVKVSLGNETKLVSGRYNSITNQFEIKNEDGKVFNIRKLPNMDFYLTESNLQYASRTFVNESGEKFVDIFELPIKGNQTLLSQSHHIYKKSEEATSGYDTAKPAYYEEDIKYFFVDHNNNLVELITNKRDIKKMYRSFSDEVYAYVKSKNIKGNSPQDYLELASFMKGIQFKRMQQGDALALNNKK